MNVFQKRDSVAEGAFGKPLSIRFNGVFRLGATVSVNYVKGGKK